MTDVGQFKVVDAERNGCNFVNEALAAWRDPLSVVVSRCVRMWDDVDQ